MPNENPRSTARIGGHPIHAMLVPIPIACFVGTLVTDIAYWKTADMQWAEFLGLAADRRAWSCRSSWCSPG